MFRQFRCGNRAAACKEDRSVVPPKYPVSPKHFRATLPDHNGLRYIGTLPTAQFLLNAIWEEQDNALKAFHVLPLLSQSYVRFLLRTQVRPRQLRSPIRSYLAVSVCLSASFQRLIFLLRRGVSGGRAGLLLAFFFFQAWRRHCVS